MLVGEVLRLSKIRLNNLAISRDEQALITLINLGVSELYNRFNLSIQSESVEIITHRALYELQNDDVAMILSIYNVFGVELKQPDVLNSDEYDYKVVNYRSFMLRRPFNGLLYVTYKGTPVHLVDEKDEIDLPDAMINALITYIAYMGHTTINRDQNIEMGNYYKMFETACQQLEAQGYRIPLNTEKVSMQSKGFV